MNDIVELSSDSNSSDTIIVPDNEYTDFLDNINCSTVSLRFSEVNSGNVLNTLHTSDQNHKTKRPEDFRDDEEDDLLNELYKKYLPSSSSTNIVESKGAIDTETLSDSDTDTRKESAEAKTFPSSGSAEKDVFEVYSEESDLLKHLFNKYKSLTEGIQKDSGLSEISEEAQSSDDKLEQNHNESAHVFGGKHKRKSYEEQIQSSEESLGDQMTKRQMVEHQRNLKRSEKERKKEELAREKALKEAVKNIQKSTLKEECIKHIVVNLDDSIFAENYGGIITKTLTENSIPFKSTKSLPGLIKWTRKIKTLENMICKEICFEERHLLLIVPSEEFSSLVHANNLVNHIQSISLQTRFVHITITVFGIDKPSEQQEYAMFEVEMNFKCYWQFTKNAEDLAAIVVTVTKSVAEIPHKLEEQEKLKLQNEFFKDVNRDTIRVDKNGHGLFRLWQQMLTMFPLARLETAEAITAVYPTPSALFEAYDRCQLNKEVLIRDLSIRRGFGPLTAVKKIGPELSMKCFKFFNSTEDVLL